MTNRTNQYDIEALHLAAPGPASRNDEPALSESQEQRDIDDLCERWVAWKNSRRLYAPPPSSGSILGQLSGMRSRPLIRGGPDAICSAELAALHLAYTCQPDTLDKRVFDLYYVHRVAPIKLAAAALKISRSHFYLLLSMFRRRIYVSSRALMEQELQALQELNSVRVRRSLSDHDDRDPR
ncbi:MULTISPECIES: hypothetical protein [unclassified Acidovorax]|uniref:hypothetical protein n=1 Tax=unclassified Acidovorax TaxID=2684926 RepID=UPI001C44D2C5|nr:MULTISPECIES: hypothetical protein [unclassified Acidovorax]MBV7459477.1 hypothetical protein [Acidovorax sp. sif0632]MBV7464502.1 hypothetical protein [Acidovorax sp. sif0613]